MFVDDEMITDVEKDFFKHFEYLLNEHINLDLHLNYTKYGESPHYYWLYLERFFFENWDFSTTSKALIGKRNFTQLTEKQKSSISNAVKYTLVRYAYEILPFYSGQKMEIVDLNVHASKSYAWLKLNIKSLNFPDIHLDILLKRKSAEIWKGIDFRFKGITYVNLKKNSYRKDFESLSFQGLLRKLDDKNKTFFTDLCQRDANYVDPKKPPCLQNYDKK